MKASLVLSAVLSSLCFMFSVGCVTAPTENKVPQASLDKPADQSDTMMIDTPYGKRPVRNPLKNVSYSELAKSGGTLTTTFPGKETKISQK